MSPEEIKEIISDSRFMNRTPAEQQVMETLLAENAILRKALEDAPHDRFRCSSLIEPIPGSTTVRNPCDCWRSALARIPEAKPNES